MRQVEASKEINRRQEKTVTGKQVETKVHAEKQVQADRQVKTHLDGLKPEPFIER